MEMKDAADTNTMDMLSTEKKRGRPKTGTAKTAAQRKREQRIRDRHAISKGLRGAELTEASTRALCEELSTCIEHGYGSLTATLMEELAKRANAKEREMANEEKKSICCVTVTRKYVQKNERN